MPGDALTTALLARSRAIPAAEYSKAGVGRDHDHHVNRFVRGDRVCWADGRDPATAAYLDWIDALRAALNRRLFLGLFDYECHYACYPVGAFYRRHLDAFRGAVNRVVSTTLYLNPEWQADDGGELVLYRGGATVPCAVVAPRLGTLVLFLSNDFPHEVLPARRIRYSMTGWFRVNGSRTGAADPPR